MAPPRSTRGANVISLRDCIAYLHLAPDEVDASACGDDQRGPHLTEVLKVFVATHPEQS